jgi:glutathionyl-hydroquinone reductase
MTTSRATDIRRLIDFPNLWRYTHELYQWPRIAGTVNLVHVKRHYYMSHRHINPSGIVPAGPTINFDYAAHPQLRSITSC